MRILLTNDDGWGTRGILTLLHELKQLGEVTVVAPDGARSAQSSAISVDKPLRLKKLEDNIYVCNGTPADCVKLALNTVFAEQQLDLVVAGINHGSNAAVNVLYSGTMGAVFVAAENRIPAIGYSITDHKADADFSYFQPYILPIARALMQMPVQYGICYNVNAPTGEIRGVKQTRQCKGYWQKEFKEYIDPMGKPFYLLTGEFCNLEPEATDTDEYALANGYIAITPTKIDMTAHNISLPHVEI